MFIKWSILILVGVGFIWAKTFGFHYSVGGDENAYFYMARLMSQGKMFYRDFFFAHPPLQLIFLTLVYSIFGFHLIALKLTAVLPVLAGAGFIYHWLWKQKNGLTGVFFLIVFLFNYELLKITTHPFGLNLTAFFLLLSIYYFLEDRPFLCGVFWGTAALTGLYALPWGVVPFAFYLLSRDRLKVSAYFLGGFLLLFGGINLLLIILFGDKYITPVYIYHFLKPRGNELVFDIYIRVIRRNLLVFFLPFLYLWGPWTRKRTALLAGGVIYLIFLASLNPLFTQYFMLPLPFISFIGAVGITGIIRRFDSRRLQILALAIAVLVLLGFTVDDIQRYLRHEAGTGFETEARCKKFIRENSEEGDLLFGHVTTVSLLALMADRDIALDMVDTNHMRFKAGLVEIEDVLDRLKREKRLKYFIIQESRFWLAPAFQKFLSRYKPVAVFDEPRERIIIYDLTRPIQEK
ncbi:MAG: hypothetical protein U9N73_02305 [Candidatus Auribacterota bacterium]|nr:hypothetical protein [Candidatus Auribacterota bacterium]